MVRGVHIDRAGSDRLRLKQALERCPREVAASRKPGTHSTERHKAKALKTGLGDYSLAAIIPDLVAEYRDKPLEAGKSASTVRLELSLLTHLFIIAIEEWRVGLVYNPVADIRKPAPPQGRDWRLTAEEERKLLQACAAHSNPMLGRIVHIALSTGIRAGGIKEPHPQPGEPGQAPCLSHRDQERPGPHRPADPGGRPSAPPSTIPCGLTTPISSSSASPAATASAGRMSFAPPGVVSARKAASGASASTTCAMRRFRAWSRPAWVIRRSPPSPVASPCRCSGATPTCGWRTW